MPDTRAPHLTPVPAARPLDAIDRRAAGVAMVHLQRMADGLRDDCHQYDLAVAASDLATSPAIVKHATALALAIGEQYGAIESKLAPPKTGIHARSLLPSPTYDSDFLVKEVDGVAYIVMRPGCRGYDPDFWELAR
jgi:hypothetical protein